ncbi:MAG: TlpA disulfide reductase family protein [Nitriliruptoraceae bacterium]
MPRSRVVAVLAVSAVLGTACASGDAVDAGPPVPAVAYTTFAGETTDLTAYAGEPVVVNFWASWCPPCVAEMPELEQVHLARGDNVRFVGINTQDQRSLAESLVEQTGVTYDLGLDPQGELFAAFEVIAMPSTFFVNDAGAVVHRHAGILTAGQLDSLIDEHLTGG